MMLERDGGCALKVAAHRAGVTRVARHTLGDGTLGVTWPGWPERSWPSVSCGLHADTITGVVNCVIFGLPRVAH